MSHFCQADVQHTHYEQHNDETMISNLNVNNKTNIAGRSVTEIKVLVSHLKLLLQFFLDCKPSYSFLDGKVTGSRVNAKTLQQFKFLIVTAVSDRFYLMGALFNVRRPRSKFKISLCRCQGPCGKIHLTNS
jgi:hypothetical protein